MGSESFFKTAAGRWKESMQDWSAERPWEVPHCANYLVRWPLLTTLVLRKNSFSLRIRLSDFTSWVSYQNRGSSISDKQFQRVSLSGFSLLFSLVSSVVREAIFDGLYLAFPDPRIGRELRNKYIFPDLSPWKTQKFKNSQLPSTSTQVRAFLDVFIYSKISVDFLHLQVDLRNSFRHFPPSNYIDLR